jgi:hypothetical protein
MLMLATADVALTFRVIVIDIPALLQSNISSTGESLPITLKGIFFVTDKQVLVQTSPSSF